MPKPKPKQGKIFADPMMKPFKPNAPAGASKQGRAIKSTGLKATGPVKRKK